MSGHSKWSSIKHQKGATDAKRGKIFTKLTQEIIVAVRGGDSNPETNSRLRLAIQRARDNSMPNDNIERAIKRGSGTLEGGELTELIMEGYGPGGVAVMVQCLTDNHNRAVQEVRHVFSHSGGGLGEKGSVAWNFEPKGFITIDSSGLDADELALKAIDAGAEDVQEEDESIEIYTKPNQLEQVRKTLEDDDVTISSAELAMIAKNTVELDERTALQTLRLLDKLEDLDDVQRVSSNADFPAEALEKYRTQLQT